MSRTVPSSVFFDKSVDSKVPQIRSHGFTFLYNFSVLGTFVRRGSEPGIDTCETPECKYLSSLTHAFFLGFPTSVQKTPHYPRGYRSFDLVFRCHIILFRACQFGFTSSHSLLTVMPLIFPHFFVLDFLSMDFNNLFGGGMR